MIRGVNGKIFQPERCGGDGEGYGEAGASIPLTPWSKFPFSLPFPLPSLPLPFLSLPSLPLPLEVGPLIAARGSGGAL